MHLFPMLILVQEKKHSYCTESEHLSLIQDPSKFPLDKFFQIIKYNATFDDLTIYQAEMHRKGLERL